MTTPIQKLDQSNNPAVQFLTIDASVNIYNRLNVRYLTNVQQTCTQISEFLKNNPTIIRTSAQNELATESQTIPRSIHSLPISNEVHHLEWTIPIVFKENKPGLAILLFNKILTKQAPRQLKLFPLPDWAYFMSAMLKNNHNPISVEKEIINFSFRFLSKNNLHSASKILIGELVNTCTFLPPAAALNLLKAVFKEMAKMDDSCKLMGLMAFTQVCPKLIPQLGAQDASTLLKQALDLSTGIEEAVVFSFDSESPNTFDTIAEDKRLTLFKDKQKAARGEAVFVQTELISTCVFLPVDRRLVLLEHAFELVNNIDDDEIKISSLEALAACSGTLGTRGLYLLHKTLGLLERMEPLSGSVRRGVHKKIVAAYPTLQTEQVIMLLERILNAADVVDDHESSYDRTEVLSEVLRGLSLLDPKSIDKLLNQIVGSARQMPYNGYLIAEAGALLAPLNKERAVILIQEGLDLLNHDEKDGAWSYGHFDPPGQSFSQIIKAIPLFDPDTAYKFLSQLPSFVAFAHLKNLHYSISKTCTHFNEPRFQKLFLESLTNLKYFKDLSQFQDLVKVIQSSEHCATYLQILLERVAQMSTFARLRLLIEIIQTCPASKLAAEMLTRIISGLEPLEPSASEEENPNDSPFELLIRAISVFSIPQDKKEGARLLNEALKISLSSSLYFPFLTPAIKASISLLPEDALPLLRRILESVKNQLGCHKIFQRIADAASHLGPENGPTLLEEMYLAVKPESRADISKEMLQSIRAVPSLLGPEEELLGYFSSLEEKQLDSWDEALLAMRKTIEALHDKRDTLDAIIENYIPFNPERAFTIILENSKYKQIFKNFGRLSPAFWSDSLKILRAYKEWGAPKDSFERLAFLIGSLQRFQKENK